MNIPPAAISQEGRDSLHTPATHSNWEAPTKRPCSHFTVAIVPSDKSALLKETVAFLMTFSMFQQFTEIMNVIQHIYIVLLF